jgi:hypothetical protein
MRRILVGLKVIRPGCAAAHLIPIQDAGLQAYLRSLDIKFSHPRDRVAG